MNEQFDLDPELDIVSIRDMIIEFNNDPIVQSLNSLYETKSFSEIINSSRKELVHSAFIAWVLNPNESHGFGSFPIRKLLELSVGKGIKKKGLIMPYQDSILVSDYELVEIEVQTERAIKNVGRLDIYIEAELAVTDAILNLRIIIENKVTTKEHKDQTNRYFEYFENRKKENDLNIYVYLTPLPTLELDQLEEPECSCKEYIQINYQQIADYLLQPTLNKDVSEHNRYLIKEYLASLSQPSFNPEEETPKQELIMALGNEERELLTKFWNKNQKLIYASLYAISVDPNQNQDDIDRAKNALENLSGGNKDRSRYTIYWNSEPVYKAFRKSDIGVNTVNVLQDQNMIDDEVFQFLRNDFSCSFQLIKTPEEVTDNEAKYSKYRVQGEPELIYQDNDYYVARNWGIGNIDKFIKKIEARFSELEIKKD
ncbi:MAG: PD-(D/E)XK nuclease family protein [Cyclobacteriaceae bacterium]